MSNPFRGLHPTAFGAAVDLIPVDPSSADVELPKGAVALYAETGGAVAVTTYAGENRTVALDNYGMLPVACTHVLQAGTTASGLHALVVA